MLTQQKKKEMREEQILLSLDELTYATREQLQIVNQLGGDRNAHRILYRMEKDKLISSIRREKKIYFLSNKGKNLIGSTQGELKKSQIQHTLMRNDLYIHLGIPKSWQKEAKLIINDEVIIISDARFKMNGKYYFVEVDNKQTMKVNEEKIQKYKEVFRMIYKEYGYHPQLIWYTLSDIRKQQLIKLCQKYAVNYKIY